MRASSCYNTASGSGREVGCTRSAKSAMSWASRRSVLASCPVALAKSRTCRGFATTRGSAAAANGRDERGLVPAGRFEDDQGRRQRPQARHGGGDALRIIRRGPRGAVWSAGRHDVGVRDVDAHEDRGRCHRVLHVTRSVLRPGNVIVLDNLAVHKQPEVRTAIETVGASSGSATLHLPPYSPDFNPIELAFAKLKALLRAARPWTFNHVYALLAAAVELFTPSACRNFVRHCAYQSAIGL